MKSMLGLLLGFLATASWGSFYIVGRWLFGEEDGGNIDPFLANLLRFFLAVLTLSPLLFIRQNRELVKGAFVKDWKKLLNELRKEEAKERAAAKRAKKKSADAEEE